VHNFSADLTIKHMTALAEKRKQQPASFLAMVIEKAPLISGYKAPAPAAAAPPGMHSGSSGSSGSAGVFIASKRSNVRFLGAQFVVPRPPGCRPGRYIPGCPNPPNSSSSSSSSSGGDSRGDSSSSSSTVPSSSSIGLVESYQVKTEGQCFAVVTIYFPANITDMTTPRKRPMPLIVWYSAAVASASAPPAAASQWAATGHAFAMVELCGFGTTGPLPSSGGLAAPSYAPEDMAHEMGRSVPGFHAGEIARVHAFLAGRADVSGIVLAVAEDHTDTALLHAILCTHGSAPETLPAKVAIVGGQASLAAAAKARLYSPNNYYAWIFGLLTVYDKPDAVAAVLSLSLPAATADESAAEAEAESESAAESATKSLRPEVLVLSPLDEMLSPLSTGAASETYAFSKTVGAERLTVEAAVPAVGVLPAITRWFGRGVDA
jgi:hypothetical protein